MSPVPLWTPKRYERDPQRGLVVQVVARRAQEPAASALDTRGKSPVTARTKQSSCCEQIKFTPKAAFSIHGG